MVEAITRSPIPGEKIVFFVRRGKQQQRLQDLTEGGWSRLLGSDVYFDEKTGNIAYISWPLVARQERLGEDFLRLSYLPRQADPSAPYSRFRDFREMRINHIEKDGEVEAAIRSVGHVIERESRVEKSQAQALRERSVTLFNHFTDSFHEISDEDFARAVDETYGLLREEGLNPATVVDRRKTAMARWVIKASSGHDYTGRRNKLITLFALSAANRVAIEREIAVDTILGKYQRMQLALMYHRDFSRGLMQEVRYYLRPEAIPAHRVFKFLQNDYTSGDVVLFLNRLRSLLGVPKINPYRRTCAYVDSLLEEVLGMLKRGEKRQIVESGIFEETFLQLDSCLEWYQDIYPNSEGIN